MCKYHIALYITVFIIDFFAMWLVLSQLKKKSPENNVISKNFLPSSLFFHLHFVISLSSTK